MGLAVAFVVAAIAVYVLWINTVIFESAPSPWPAFVVPIGAGILLFGYEFVRRALRKRGYLGGYPALHVKTGAAEEGEDSHALLSLIKSTSTALPGNTKHDNKNTNNNDVDVDAEKSGGDDVHVRIGADGKVVREGDGAQGALLGKTPSRASLVLRKSASQRSNNAFNKA